MRDLPIDPPILLTVFAAVALVGSVLWVFARHHATAIGLLLAVQVWTVAVGPMAGFQAGITFYPADILAVGAFCTALGRLLLHGLPARAGLLPVLALAALTGWSTLYGIAAFGLQTAGNDSRVYFWYVLAAVLYTATAPPGAKLDRAVTRAWLTCAVVYAALCLADWAGAGLRPITDPVVIDGVAVDPRPVPAAAALVLAQSAVLLLFPLGSGSPALPTRARAARWVPALALAFTVILLQHRTVWAAAAAMALAGWALRPTRAGRAVSGAVVAVAVCLAALANAYGAFGGVGGTLAASAGEAQNSHSTFTWRVVGWQDLLHAPRSLVQWLIGAPFGSGYQRLIAGHLVTVSPHDYYLHVGLRLGLVGLVLLLVVYALAWRQLSQRGPGVLALRVMIIGQLVFFVAYPAFPEQGVLLGLCLWQARASADPATGRPPAAMRPGEAVVCPAPTDRQQPDTTRARNYRQMH